MELIDLTGKRFGRLIVIKRAGTYTSPHGQKAPIWLCKCDCGNYCEVVRGSLVNGYTKSCGCYRSETNFNNYHIEDGIVHVLVKNKEFLIDQNDLWLIQNERWHIGKNGYVARNRDKKLLHRLLFNEPKGKVIDHINHNKLDNRRSNLRIVDYSINGINKRKLKIGKSGEPFINYNKSNHYYSVIVDNNYCGGSYDLEKAVVIRNKALKGSKAEKYNPCVKKLLMRFDYEATV